MKVVITGASGFLGEALLKVLTENKINSIGLSRDEFSDLTHVIDYSDAPSGDILVHLAESNDRKRVNEKGAPYEQKCLELLDKLLGSKRYQRIIYASSSVLYGDQNLSPRKEGDLLFVTDSYTRLKHASEKMVYSREGVVLRLANIYGYNMSKQNVTSAILSQIEGTGPVILNSTTPIRDFLWIEDAVEVIFKIIQKDLSGIYNIGSGIGTSIGELAQKVIDAAGEHDREIISSEKSDSISKLVLDISKTVEATDWGPTISLEEGILKLLINKKNNKNEKKNSSCFYR